MKFLILIYLSLSSLALATNLPLLSDKGWVGSYTVSRGSFHAVSVLPNGNIEFFLMKRAEKLNRNWPIEMKMRLQRRAKGSTKWVNKTIKKNGFISPVKGEMNMQKVTLNGVVTGGIKFRLDFVFIKGGVQVSGEIVDPPKNADFRLSLESNIDELIKTKGLNEKQIKKKVKGNELRMESRKERGLRVKFHEKLEPAELTKHEVTEVVLKAAKVGRRKIVWRMPDEKLGKLEIESKSETGIPAKGFYVRTLLVDETGKKVGSGMILELK